ncbi:hypothetical protein LXL04_006888 [Taraxacum kok-saghyz]
MKDSGTARNLQNTSTLGHKDLCIKAPLPVISLNHDRSKSSRNKVLSEDTVEPPPGISSRDLRRDFYSPVTTLSFAGKSDDQGTQRLLPPCSSTVAVISHRDRVVVARVYCLRGRSRPGSSRLRERTSFATKSIGVKPIITTSGHQSPPSASPATTAVAVSSTQIFCYIPVVWSRL